MNVMRASFYHGDRANEDLTLLEKFETMRISCHCCSVEIRTNFARESSFFQGPLCMQIPLDNRVVDFCVKRFANFYMMYFSV